MLVVVPTRDEAAHRSMQDCGFLRGLGRKRFRPRVCHSVWPSCVAFSLFFSKALYAQAPIGDGSVENSPGGPSAAHGLGQGAVLVKNWDFGTKGNIPDIKGMNAEFQYRDQFNQFNNGNGNYGAPTVAPSEAESINKQPVEGVATGGRKVREFLADSLRTYLVPLDGATQIEPTRHNLGCGSFVAKWSLPSAGSHSKYDIIWETRVRYEVPPYFWFALWTSGRIWRRGAEVDVVESFGYDNGLGRTNFDGRYWHVGSVGGSDAISFKDWSRGMSKAGITDFDASAYHVWTLVYRTDDSYAVFMDGKQVQNGSIHWTVGGKRGAEVLDLRFLFDGSWGHTKIASVNRPLPASAFEGKYYDWDYSRVYLRPPLQGAGSTSKAAVQAARREDSVSGQPSSVGSSPSSQATTGFNLGCQHFHLPLARPLAPLFLVPPFLGLALVRRRRRA